MNRNGQNNFMGQMMLDFNNNINKSLGKRRILQIFIENGFRLTCFNNL